MPFMLGNITFYDYILNVMKESMYVSSMLEQCWYLVWKMNHNVKTITKDKWLNSLWNHHENQSI